MPGTVEAYVPENCIKCHGEKSEKSSLQIPLEAFKASVHSKELSCQDCHTGVIDDSHQTIIGSGAVDCTQCHDQENRHGLQRRDNRPKCYSCHTRHRILRRVDKASSVNPKQLRYTCKICHPAECGQTDYLSFLPSLKLSSHKKQDFAGDYSVLNCIGCHQGMAAHGGDEIISKQSCHKCHLSRQGSSLLMGYMHPKADRLKQSGIFAAAIIYQVAVVIVLVGGFGFFIRFFGTKSCKEK
jgi:hypothetical protein